MGAVGAMDAVGSGQWAGGVARGVHLRFKARLARNSEIHLKEECPDEEADRSCIGSDRP